MPTTRPLTPEAPTMFLVTWLNTPTLHTEQHGATVQGVDVATFAELFPYIVVQELAA